MHAASTVCLLWGRAMSEVTICNLALSHLGDTATVASIRPPDASVQAQLCARFYPIARNSLLEMEAWGFAARRALLALVADPLAASDDSSCPKPWRFAYAVPGDLLNALAVQDKDAPGDYQAWLGPIQDESCRPYPQGYMPLPGAPLTVSQPYEIETLDDQTQIILTDVENAVLRYTGHVENTAAFSFLFTTALSYLLASMLAGPILKGDAGIQAATQQLALFEQFKGKAAASDANQRKTRLEPAPSWIRGR